MANQQDKRLIEIDYITKIEGHAKLVVKIERGEVRDAHLEVFEGSRFFESLLKRRACGEAASITSRICGVCSIAHVIAAIKAVEAALGIQVSRQCEQMRKVMLLGQFVYSHALHLFVMSLPDYLGFESTFTMARRHPEKVRLGLRLAALGDKAIATFGGREPHPIASIVGGFTALPSRASLEALLASFKASLSDALEGVRLFSSLSYPVFERETEWLALRHEGRYAIMGGELCSSAKAICLTDYQAFLEEYTTPESTAKFVTLENKAYQVGALSRMNLNAATLSPTAKEALRQSGLRLPSRNPFHNNLAQAIEIVHCIERCIAALEELLEKPLRVERLPVVKRLPRRMRGIGVIEAPRGVLFHDYAINTRCVIEAANIVTPTAQNLRRMEEDVKLILPPLLERGASRKEIIDTLEMLIRAYDPCISCAAHFLEVKGLP